MTITDDAGRWRDDLVREVDRLADHAQTGTAGGALLALSALQRLRRDLLPVEAALVALARDEGVPWSELAAALDVRKSTVYEQYGPGGTRVAATYREPACT